MVSLLLTLLVYIRALINFMHLWLHLLIYQLISLSAHFPIIFSVPCLAILSVACLAGWLGNCVWLLVIHSLPSLCVCRLVFELNSWGYTFLLPTCQHFQGLSSLYQGPLGHGSLLFASHCLPRGSGTITSGTR